MAAPLYVACRAFALQPPPHKSTCYLLYSPHLLGAAISVFGEGAETLTAIATDAAGNVNAANATRAITVDTIACAATTTAYTSGTLTATLGSPFSTAGTFGFYTAADGVTLYTETVRPASGSTAITSVASITKNVDSEVQSSVFAIVKNSSNVIVGGHNQLFFHWR